MKNFFKYKIRVKIASSNKHHLINRENKTYSCTLLFIYSKSFSSYFLSFLSSKSALLLSSINSLSVTSVFFTTSHTSKLRLIIAHVKAAAWIINRILYSRMFRIKLWRFHKELLTFNFYFLFFFFASMQEEQNDNTFARTSSRCRSKYKIRNCSVLFVRL